MLVSAGESRTKTVTFDPAAPDIRSHGAARAVTLAYFIPCGMAILVK